MTTPDIAGLCERLRRVAPREVVSRVIVNPDGPQAADTLERQAAKTLERHAAEIERLRSTLGYYSYADDGGKRARAALTGEA